MEEVYEVIFSSIELKTVEDYVADPGSPASKFKNKEEEFLKVKNKEGKTNKDAILERFRSQSYKEEILKLPAKQYPLKVGTKLAIPVKQVDRVGLLTQGIEVVSNDIPAFKAKKLAELELNEGYNPIRKTSLVKGKLNYGTLVESYPEITVWVWCRALSNSNKLGDENKGQIFNITPFVQKLTTNMSKNGGNFQISLPPLACEFNSESGSWEIKKRSITHYKSSAENLTQQNEGYIAESSLLTQDSEGNIKRSQFLFHNILSTNDLVFIRFETLELEKEQRISDNQSYIVDKKEIPNRIYDMIGLIDENSQSVNGSMNDVTINISGRDLSKLFIEDGTYFYALEMSQGQLNFAGGSTQKNELMQRVFSENSLYYFGLYFNNSIENIFKFVIQQLSTIKIVPNDLFESYGERRNKKFNLERKQIEQKQSTSDQLKQYKEEACRCIKSIRKQVLLTESSRNKEDSETQEIWSQFYNFFKSIRKENVRETVGSVTSGWRSFSYLNNGKVENIQKDTLPLFFYKNMHLVLFYKKSKTIKNDEEKLFISLDNYIDLEESNPDHKDVWKEEYADGIWQIIKLVIDEGITNRRVVDSSASSANGSLLNFFRKVCQEPFVEFYMDTYGDMYHLIARKPPTNKEGLISMLDKQVLVNSEESGVEKIQSVVIDIEPEDVIQEQLSYDDQNAISWYHLNPQNNFLGNNSTYSLAYLPAIFFEEYAEIWGSRPLQIIHNYMPRLPLNTQETNLDISEEQAYEDMKYLIESSAYLPFTRKGTIIINGDRRLKIGNICRYKPTGEIFFIEGVQQNFQISENSIERTTTIQVSRGMIENLIRGVNLVDENGNVGDVDKGEYASYFTIINTDLDIQEKTVKDKIVEQVQVGTEIVQRSLDYNDNYSKESNIQVNALFAAANRYRGYRYGLGKRGGDMKTIDCSGFVSNVLKIAGAKVIPDTSENLMIRSNNFRQASIPLNSAFLMEGDVIGIDTGNYEFDKGRRYGIDHIGIVVRNFNTGELELAESTRSTGVIFRPISQGIARYNKISRKMWIGDYRGNNIGNSSSIERPIYEERVRYITRKEIDRAKVFSNFQVYKPCFNFFLRKYQNDVKYSREGEGINIKSVTVFGKNKEL